MMIDREQLKLQTREAFQGIGVFGVVFSWFLIVLIFGVVVSFALWTVPEIRHNNEDLFLNIEILIGSVFLVEYLLRIWSAENRKKYIFSFWGLIDFLACLPVILAFGPELSTLRALRIIRLLQVLKFLELFGAYDRLSNAFLEVRDELLVFFMLAAMVVIFGAFGIYMFEHKAQPEVFGSVPDSIWWAVVTLTTVGYGDAYPITAGGKIFTGLLLVVGLGVIAVPTALFSTSLINAKRTHSHRHHDETKKDE